MRREIVERNILFLCQDNACLSQIAEATAKHLAPPKTRIFSAGAEPARIPDPVIQAMRELGISMTGHKSKGLAEVPMQDIDLIISFGDAHKNCGEFPRRTKVETWKVPGPRQTDNSGAQGLATLRSQRDEIGKRVFALFLDYWRNIA